MEWRLEEEGGKSDDSYPPGHRSPNGPIPPTDWKSAPQQNAEVEAATAVFSRTGTWPKTSRAHEQQDRMGGVTTRAAQGDLNAQLELERERAADTGTAR